MKLLILCGPAALYFLGALVQGAFLIFNFKVSELLVRKLSQFIAISAALLASISLVFWLKNSVPVNATLFHWFIAHDAHANFQVYWSGGTVVYSLLSAFLVGTVLRFSFSYLHKDPGFHRFFFLTHLLGFSTQLLAIAATWDEWFMGWELTGIASVFLIQFFQSQTRPVQNSYRALINYRICDAFLLAAIALIHHYDLPDTFSDLRIMAHDDRTFLIGLFIIIGTLAKSAQFPLTQWLQRAIEGPTGSSAVFYGALSIHLGPFLLMRSRGLWAPHPELVVLVALIGVLTATFASLMARVRADVKSVLAYSTAAQVGVIYVEVALGLDRLAWIHLTLHACLRTWQFLRSSSLIHDFFDNPLVKERLRDIPFSKTSEWSKWLYIFSMNGASIEALEKTFIVSPFLKVGRVIGELPFFGGASFVVGICIWSTFGFAPFIDSSIVTIITVFLFLALGHGTKSLNKSYWLLVASQWVMVFSQRKLDAWGIWETALPLLLSAFPFVLIAVFTAKFGKLESYPSIIGLRGLAKLDPEMSGLLLFTGLFALGIPVSLSFWTEDSLFHRMLETSQYSVIALILYSILAPALFLRSHFTVFCGEPAKQETEISHLFSGWIRWFLRAWVIVQVVFGVFPQLIVRFL